MPDRLGEQEVVNSKTGCSHVGRRGFEGRRCACAVECRVAAFSREVQKRGAESLTSRRRDIASREEKA